DSVPPGRAIPTMSVKSTEKDFSRAITGLIVLYLPGIAYAIYVQQHFFADGSHFFLKLLEERWFIYSDDFARHHAHYFTEALTVALLRVFRIKDVDILSYSFGVGLYLPQIISLVACYFVARKTDIRFMLFPLIALFGISANHFFIISHEAHVAAIVFWPLFMYVLLQKEYDKTNAFVALALSLLFIRTYETVAVLGTILLLLLAMRIWGDWSGASALTRSVWLLMALIFLVGIAIALYSATFPRSPENRSDFFASFARVVHHWPAMMSLGYMALIALFFLAPRLGRSPWYGVALAAAIPVTVVVGLCPVLDPGGMRPGLHYATRAFMVVMTPLLSILAFLVLRGVINVPEVSWKRIGALVLLLAIGQTGGQVLAAGQWNGFRQVFREEL